MNTSNKIDHTYPLSKTINCQGFKKTVTTAHVNCCNTQYGTEKGTHQGKETLHGLPSGFDIMYLALADRNMQVRFGLKVGWEF